MRLQRSGWKGSTTGGGRGTVNGLVAREDGDVIDLVGGIADLRAGRIRTIGDPSVRFNEDYLRMLRAVRFACQIPGKIDPDTADAIAASAPRILSISNERIRDELFRLLRTKRAADGIEMLDQLSLLEHILPELHATKGVPQPEEYHPEGDVFVHTMAVRTWEVIARSVRGRQERSANASG